MISVDLEVGDGRFDGLHFLIHPDGLHHVFATQDSAEEPLVDYRYPLSSFWRCLDSAYSISILWATNFAFGSHPNVLLSFINYRQHKKV